MHYNCPVQTDVFTLVCNGLGTISEMLIGHDNSGVTPNWYMESASILDEATQTTYWCVMCYVCVCLTPFCA